MSAPAHDRYDIVIVGGGMIGSSIAWWCARDPDFDGRILVVEADPTFEHAATSHTNSCIRQQFGTELNIRISQFGAAFIRDFAGLMEDPEAPALTIRTFGYMYLAADPAFAAILAEQQLLQASLGAGTRMMTPDEIAAAYPFYALDDIVAGSHNTRDEGYFDGGTIFHWLRKRARALGVETLHDRVTDLTLAVDRVTHVTLASGARIACGQIVNAAGTRSADIAAMAGLSLPVVPHKRYTFIFDAEDPLPRDLPLTIDPSGIHVRSDGASYMAGCAPDDDGPVDPADFAIDHDLWQDTVWPALAHRIPAFERIRLRTTWVGHYDTNTLDRNAVLGPDPRLPNFHFASGFSGHGLQQSPAVGRGLAEMLVHGRWRSLDLSPLGPGRIAANEPLLERAII